MTIRPSRLVTPGREPVSLPASECYDCFHIHIARMRLSKPLLEVHYRLQSAPCAPTLWLFNSFHPAALTATPRIMALIPLKTHAFAYVRRKKNLTQLLFFCRFPFQQLFEEGLLQNTYFVLM